ACVCEALAGKGGRIRNGGQVRLMRRALIWLALAGVASALPAHWAAAQFKNEGMGVLVPPTRGIPHPAPGYNPIPPPTSAPTPVPAPAPAQSSSSPPPSPPPAGGQPAK